MITFLTVETLKISTSPYGVPADRFPLINRQPTESPTFLATLFDEVNYPKKTARVTIMSKPHLDCCWNF
jgi:hypothetical protein